MAFTDSNSEWQSRGQKDATGAGTLVKPPCLRGNVDRAPSFELYSGIRLTTEEKSWKNLSKGSRPVMCVCDLNYIETRREAPSLVSMVVFKAFHLVPSPAVLLRINWLVSTSSKHLLLAKINTTITSVNRVARRLKGSTHRIKESVIF